MRMRGRKKSRAVARLSVGGGLRLTSLMDMLTTLLLFLLTTYVGGGAESIVPPPGLALPSSTADGAPEATLVLAIDDRAVMLGSEAVASIDDVLGTDGPVIAPLDERLKAVLQQREEIAALKGQEVGPAPAVTIQGDRKIEYRVLEKVMFTLQQNGFGNIALAVLKKA